MIGAKTVMSSLLFATAIVLAVALGSSPARFAALGPMEAFSIGLFAFLAGGLAHRYFRLYQRSTYYLRWSEDSPWADETHFLGNPRRRIMMGENRGDAYDFSPRVQYAIYVALAMWIALITLDSRAVALLAEIPEKVAAGGSEYCREPELTAVATKVEEEPGCALIRRAFELGYAKSLGPCEPKAETKIRDVCTLRQKDEPILHYAWRRLSTFEDAAAKQMSSKSVAETQATFEVRTDHLRELYAANGFTVSNAPRASHHIFTNLPNPGGWLADANGDVLEQRDCADRYRRLPPRIGSASPSEQLEHVVAQLLFDTRYARSVGSCRELTIHWGAPANACDELEIDPSRFLSKTGALGAVTTVLRRYHVTAELQEALSTAHGMSTLASILRSVPPGRFVSFSCYIEEERSDVAVSARDISLNGEKFVAGEVRVPAAAAQQGIDDRYHHVASMLIPSFHYGNLLSDASPELLEAGVDAKFFAGKDGFLSRLDYLSDVDIFLGNDWIEQREDLLEVYPYNVHLQNYVALFRGRYRAERGRL